MRVYDGSEPAGDREPERRKVGIAEWAVTTRGAVVTTSGLGSCVGVALFDGRADAAGLAHVMLPSADDAVDDNAAKYADSGVELLVEEMERAGASVADIEAKIAGGSSMLDLAESGPGIGVRNVEQVRVTLEAVGVPVVAEDVGGGHGRSLRLEPQSEDLVVRSADGSRRRL